MSAAAMKVLYVNGTYEGGSLMSTRELIGRLSDLGAEVRLIHASQEVGVVKYVRRRATNLAVKLGGPDSQSLIEKANRWWGSRPRETTQSQWTSGAVENAARSVLESWKPDVVVVSSIDRMAWRRIRRDTAAAGTACVLYLREEALLPHLGLASPPDLVLANSRGLVESAEQLGWHATLVPSVIDLSICEVDSERTKTLLLNPTLDYGLDSAVRLAELCPEIEFVFQESTRLTPEQTATVLEIGARLPNVELRPFTTDVAAVYADARLLLAPYTDRMESNRPRSVLEAHHNGIPVLGMDRAGLRDAVGEGGVLLAPETSDELWASTLRTLYTDERAYAALVDRSRTFAQRPEVDPDAIARVFLSTLGEL